jgi:formylglycine-generating enzyme required for sulfatase activity
VALKEQVRGALIERTQDGSADLRARIAAGLALGELGDPRFERHQGPHGAYLLPPMVEIGGGAYTIGSDKGDPDERPVHTVELAPFWIGKFPVTNAEWELFMQADGYANERWWETEEVKAWQRGEGTTEEQKQEQRKIRQRYRNDPDYIHELARRGQFTSLQVQEWEEAIRMSDDEFEALLDTQYPPGRQTQPRYWNNETYNNPAQPVVGICWYEACAYCAWLSAQTGQLFRLPSEAEWEAAIRGLPSRCYAYGDDFDPDCCNTFETHIRRTTPIGVFPGGETPEGLVDMTGNAWEWTSSLYRPYPYRADDGREAPITGDNQVVMRGGSWFNTLHCARASFRAWRLPHVRGLLDSQGARVVCLSPIKL